MARVLVTGATSVVGRYLVPKLKDLGHDVTAFSRQPHGSGHGVIWCQVDAVRTPLRELVPGGADALVNLAPLTLLPHLLVGLPLGISHVVGVGTTSVFTKSGSSAPKDQRIVTEQRAAEQEIAGWCRGHGMVFTLLRPTLVYDGLHDKNVARIARLVQLCGFFPVAAPGRGLRQPLHAGDLAEACIAALGAASSASYNLAGGEVLSYRAMLERIFRALGRRPRVLPVPLVLYRGLIVAARILPRFRDLSTEVADRMNLDMVFDCSEAARDLNFRPRGFMPEFPP